MSRMSRTLRRAIAPAAVIIGLLAVPGSALAAPAVGVTSITGAGSPAAGDVRAYDVVLTNADAVNPTTVASSVTVDLLSGDDIVISGTPAATAGSVGDQAKVSCAAGSDTCTIAAGFDDTVTVRFNVLLPKVYTQATDFRVRATLSGAEASGSATAPGYEVKKGGPSNLVGSFSPLVPAAGVTDKWVTKGSTVSTTLTITNSGAGAADFAVIDVSAFGNASILSPDYAPNPAFAPTVALTSAVCAPTTPGRCEIAELAAGASATVTVQISGLTHFGYVGLDAEVVRKAESDSFDALVDFEDFNSIAVTDGTISEPHVAVGTAVDTAAGNTNIAFKGEVTNNGAAAITGAVLRITSGSFLANGSPAGGTNHVGDAGVTQSIQSVTLSNGAACANEIDHGVSPAVAYLDRFVCPVASLAPGARLTFDAVARFATAKADTSGSIDAELIIAGYPSDDASPYDADSVSLNASKTIDLQITATSAALVGLDRVGLQTITVTNKGNTKATSVFVNGSINGGLGTFDSIDLPASCTSIAKPKFSSCTIGELAPGASKTVTLGVHAGLKLGSLPVNYFVGGNGGTEVNSDDNSVTQTMTIVKANAVPLLGVIVAKAPAQAMAKVAKTGVKSVVTVPGPATVKVDLIVTAKVAQTLGLVKAPKKSTKKAKKAPAFYTICTSTTKVAAAGKVTTTTKLTKKYVKKLLAAKKKFAVKRTITVVSTAPKTAGASSMTSQTLTFTPAKAKKGKK
ncbi:MAG: hypothetical protein JWN72_124 [Thermoleophilia bacterium]|nr:hypothetical protein [Thermoleophilia bacterium]